jgi:hypothetical protein
VGPRNLVDDLGELAAVQSQPIRRATRAACREAFLPTAASPLTIIRLTGADSA